MTSKQQPPHFPPLQPTCSLRDVLACVTHDDLELNDDLYVIDERDINDLDESEELPEFSCTAESLLQVQRVLVQYVEGISVSPALILVVKDQRRVLDNDESDFDYNEATQPAV